MGGTKRKLPMEKIENKASRAVCFSKRRSGLYSKASELCLLSGAQMAILTTPCSSESNVSFYSFGHSSVDGVVDSFLKDQRPVREDIVGYTSRDEDLGLGFWWEDESLAKSENAEELSGAIDSISRMLRDLKELRSNNQDDVKNNEIKKRNLVLHERQKLDRTLNLQSSSATFGIPDDRFKTDTEMVVFDDQVLAISETTDNPTGNLDGYSNQELDLDQLIDFGSLFDEDFETNLEHQDTAETSLFMNSEMENVSMVTTNPNLCSDFKAVEDEAFGASQRFG